MFSNVYTYHIVFIQSSTKGHFDCLRVLATVNITAVNIGIFIFANKCVCSFLWHGYPGEKLLGYMITLFLIFWGTTRLFSIVAAPVYIPTSSEWGFLFSITSPVLVITCLVANSCSDRCELVSQYSFDLHFPVAGEVEHLFIYLLAVCMSSWERCLFRSFVHFSIGLFFWCRVLWIIYIFWILNLCWNLFVNIISYFVGCLFILLVSFVFTSFAFGSN